VSECFDDISWNDQGLVAAIAQDYKSKRVLMMAWMNRESLELSIKEERAIYWSRSRGKLWRKGEESGNVQLLKNVYLDCDGDALVLEVEQLGDIACHTGRESCFYRQLQGDSWENINEVIKDPADMYKK
jgi:phosphoribosyl-AMP cyclohydrolase